MDVLGRRDSQGPVASVGHFRARDGSRGGEVGLDLNRPHAALVVGKRGSGKSCTLGVLAEEVAQASGIAPVILDPMGAFSGLAEAAGEFAATVERSPTIAPETLSPRAWCGLFDLDPADAVGSLVWRAARAKPTLDAMEEFVETAEAGRATRRAALNHLALAREWGCFGPDGLSVGALCTSALTVLDCAGLPAAPMNAIGRAVADALYQARMRGEIDWFPWLLVDEAHVFFDGLAAPALRTLLTRGRQPGVSLVAATQRPGALPPVAHSHADLLVVHRVTNEADRRPRAPARPTYLDGSFAGRMPTEPGEALIVDDVTERMHAVKIRPWETAHGGDTPFVSSLTE
ncbi:ATP-binding protein [Haladaptatus sp. GCM10025707]|uniref:ATP-binding protein n=1 Tax=unclassified Haladaptatus TaxID=2622732 RepID=UPI0023E83154|nr:MULTISPECIES: DUF87 domain-containing protein [unclassified Haladaptatus]